LLFFALFVFYADTYDAEVGLADIALDTEEIALVVREIRGG
jgi:hypothetical protein